VSFCDFRVYINYTDDNLADIEALEKSYDHEFEVIIEISPLDNGKASWDLQM
jgi:hypothetical protein